MGMSLSSANTFKFYWPYILSFNKYFTKQALVFTCLQYKSFENTVGKGDIARNEHNVFYPFGELSTIFIKFEIVICKLLSLKESNICGLGKG